MTDGASWSAFTPTEQATIALVCRGCTNKEIGALRQITPEWVRKQITGINRRLGTGTRTEIVAHAATHWPWLFGRLLATDDDPILYG